MRKLNLTENEAELDHQIVLRRRARAKYAYALSIGKIRRQPCIKCGKEAEGHHPNLVEEPLRVVWPCSEHHKEEHDQLRVSAGKSPAIFGRVPQALYDEFCTLLPGLTMSERLRDAIQQYVEIAKAV